MLEALYLILSLLVVTAGAEVLVRGASRLALGLGLSPLVVGLTVVGFGTSAPELSASVAATLRGATSVSVGNVVGSNIFNIGVVLGASALIHPIRVQLRALRRDLLVALAASLAPVAALSAAGRLVAWHGVVLLAALVVFVAATVVRGRRATADEQELVAGELAAAVVPPAPGPAPRSRWTSLAGSVALVLGGLAALVLGSRWFVSVALDVAGRLGVSELVIGLTVVAMGTSLPELVTSVVAARRGSPDIAVGNVIGSNIFNLLGILGLSAVLGSQEVSREALLLHTPVMLVFTVALLPLVRSGNLISRAEGGLLMGAYAVYLAALLLLG